MNQGTHVDSTNPTCKQLLHRRQHLPRVHQILRIERLLDGTHHSQRRCPGVGTSMWWRTARHCMIRRYHPILVVQLIQS